MLLRGQVATKEVLSTSEKSETRLQSLRTVLLSSRPQPPAHVES